MGVIRIAMPPKNPYCIGRFAAVNMDTDQELSRACPASTAKKLAPSRLRAYNGSSKIGKDDSHDIRRRWHRAL